jgi:hypothetical protein
MVYKCPFLKQVIEQAYVPAKDGPITWELTDEALAAVWLSVYGDKTSAAACINDILTSIMGIDVWLGSFNVMHYTTTEKAMIMNCMLKQHWPYHVAGAVEGSGIDGVTFPLLFGAPYLLTEMALPRSLSNRKKLTLTFDVATTYLSDLYIDISEVLLPDANPIGFIKQEEISVEAKGTGDKDLWLQTNWDTLKMLLYSTHVTPDDPTNQTIVRAGVEINDFPFGYKNVPWQHLHGEMMDELEGSGPVEDHYHVDSSSGDTGFPLGLESWVNHYGVLDFFHNKNLKWRLPCAGASTAKLKYNAGEDEAWNLATASYVPTSKVS